MKQDIIVTSSQRGAIRPPARPIDPVSRPPVTRGPLGSPVSIDGMKSVSSAPHKSLIAMAPAPVLKPAVSPAQARVSAISEASVQSVQQTVPQLVTQTQPTDISSIENRLASELTSLPTGAPVVVTQPVVSNPVLVTPTLQESVEKEGISNDKPEKQKKRFDFKKHGLISLAVVVVLVTAYVSVDTWLTNRQVQAITTGDTSSTVTSGAHDKTNEGKEEAPISEASLSSYSVSAEYPRALYINKLGVAARVLPMSINTDGSVQSPVNIFDAGWYTGSVKPGEIGASFIDGHASGPTRQGLFGSLDTLATGDTLEVEKGNGERLTYKVVHTETVPLEGLDMRKVLLPHGNSLKSLNLMTCTGEWLDDKQTFDHRVIVYTELVQ